MCFNELKQQETEEAKYNPSRSWSALKKAINVYFIEHIAGGLEREDYYKIIVNELLTNNSELKKAIHKALINFRKEYEINIKHENKNNHKDVSNLMLPPREMSYTDDFEEMNIIKQKKDLGNEYKGKETSITKNVYEEFYIKKEYTGKKNELQFIEFLENQNIDWWHKQNDSGRDCFAIEYTDSQEKKTRLFYPDFIIKKGNKIYLLDTKSGSTAKSKETADKNQSLQKWIETNSSKYDFELIGGIVKFEYPHWKINRQENYIYENENDWENLNLE